ncbi:hypothetical protein ACFU53_27790 [Streptomyces sp. NPDC057474]|uniref:hypothetical protein n=1 Tax=Streptomyces sp. NPDC057474 TaxID=3346144 RepID=UPI00367C9BDA
MSGGRRAFRQDAREERVPEEDVLFVAAAEDEREGVDVSGRQARVVFPADTLFLSQFSRGW